MTERRETTAVDCAARHTAPHEASAHALVERQARRTPDHTAVCAANESLSYRELDRRANQLAHVLAMHGVGAGCRVGILLRHSIETVVAVVGVLKSGAAYVPLDPDFPVTRVRHALNHADVGVVVTTSDLGAMVGQRSTLSFDADAALLASAPGTRPDVRTGPGDPAYVIYTSGSSGAPKGIVIPHRALVNYVLWANAVYLDNQPRNFALHSSLAFDLTVTSIFSPITTGGTVMAYPARHGAPPIVDVLREDRVEIVKLTPSHLAFVAEQSTAPSRLKTFIVGGENLDTALARRVHEKFGGRAAIFNEYGPTETTVGCMIHRYDPERDRRASVPIGGPAANTRILVLDERLEPVAPDVVGELYVGGAGLATGYLGDRRLTEERFINDPFEPGARLYRTGDLAKSLPDGALEFLGRNDDQIKMRGHRIHLSEVRHVVTQHPDVRDCAIRHFEDVDGTSVLVAYYTANAPIDARALRAFSREHLVQAAVPSAFVFLERLPLTLNGKVDVRVLPELDEVRQSDRTDRQPRTATEEKLAGIWCRLLRYKRVGIDESFFDLGGDSLMAIQLFLEIEEAFGVRLQTSVLFSEATIERVAEAIEGRQTARKGSHLVCIRPQGTRPPLFLFHGIGGEAVAFEPLVRHLPPAQPVYGLQGDGINFQEGSTLQIESMASAYLEAIREVQPDGPYFLAGYSAGGVTAYETAMQIREAGGDVGLLAIIDGDAPPAVRGTWRWTPRTLGRFTVNLARWTADDLMRSSAADVGARVQSKLRLLRSRLRARLSASPGGQRRSDVLDTAGVPQLPERYIPWVEAFVGAIDKYRPRRYPARIVLLRARVFGLFQQVVPDRGWTPLTGDLSIRVVKGNHTSIMQEPLVSHVADELERLLRGDAAT